MHYKVLICGWHYLCRLLCNFQFLKSYFKISSILFVFTFKLKISSSLVTLIKFKRLFVFKLFLPYSSTSFQKFKNLLNTYVSLIINFSSYFSEFILDILLECKPQRILKHLKSLNHSNLYFLTSCCQSVSCNTSSLTI